MDLTEYQMDQLKSVEMDILKKFIWVCEQLDLDYFIVQGTLLGAVRHKGFIPWDDDIDVGMRREDYEVFLEKGQSFLGDEFFLQNTITDSEYPHGFSKIRKKNTIFLETTCKNLSMNHGIYMDVFPFDFYPENKWKALVFELKKCILRYRIRSSLFVPQDNEIGFSNTIKRGIKAVSHIFYPSVKEAKEKQMLLYKQYSKGNLRANMGSPWGARECIPAEWINKTVSLQFENLTVKAPISYKEYLSHVYGDYMKLPALSERKPHHYICELRFENTK